MTESRHLDEAVTQKQFVLFVLPISYSRKKKALKIFQHLSVGDIGSA